MCCSLSRTRVTQLPGLCSHVTFSGGHTWMPMWSSITMFLSHFYFPSLALTAEYVSPMNPMKAMGFVHCSFLST